MNNRILCGRMKDMLDRGEFCRGLHCSTSDLGFYEISALSGVDYVWIDTEHAAVNISDVLHGMMILQARGVSAIVRVPKCDAVLAKPYLDNGADGIVFPMVNSPEEAAAAVAACRYAPRGGRGYGPERASGYGELTPAMQVEFADRQVMPIIQIEHYRAVERVDEIFAVDGIDYAVIGPMDLSLSVDKVGQMDDPEVRQMMETIITKAEEHGVKLGLSLGVGSALYEYGKARGVAFISVGNPHSFYKRALMDWIEKA